MKKRKPGRPRTGRRPSITVVISKENEAWLRTKENMSGTVNALITRAREGKVVG